jgi:Mg/Co/Ni transporter MgtE
MRCQIFWTVLTVGVWPISAATDFCNVSAAEPVVVENATAVLGLAMPFLFRMLKGKPQVAAGPIALASADAVTLLVYFNFARWLLA